MDSDKHTSSFSRLLGQLSECEPLKISQERHLCWVLHEHRSPLYLLLWALRRNNYPISCVPSLVRKDWELVAQLQKLPLLDNAPHPEPLDIEVVAKLVAKAKRVGLKPEYTLTARQNQANVRKELGEQALLLLTPKALDEALTVSDKLLSRYVRARSQFCHHNLRLVMSIVRRYSSGANEHTLMDYFQEGAKGLMKAVDRYAVETGNKFSTYATWWIRQQICRYIQDNSNTIRLPSHVLDIRHKMFRFIEAYYNENFKEPSHAVIGKHFKIPPEKVAKLLELTPTTISIHQSADPNDDSPDSPSMAERIADPDSLNPIRQASATSLQSKIIHLLDGLSERERKVIMLRFGIGDAKKHTLEEVGKHMQVTRERIRQIEDRAIRRLRHPRRLLTLQEMD